MIRLEVRKPEEGLIPGTPSTREGSGTERLGMFNFLSVPVEGQKLFLRNGAESTWYEVYEVQHDLESGAIRILVAWSGSEYDPGAR